MWAARSVEVLISVYFRTLKSKKDIHPCSNFFGFERLKVDDFHISS